MMIIDVSIRDDENGSYFATIFYWGKLRFTDFGNAEFHAALEELHTNLRQIFHAADHRYEYRLHFKDSVE